MWCTVTIIQSTVCTHGQKAQAFDSVPGRTAKNPVCFSGTSPCLCVLRRKLSVSLLIRCYKWKTLLFTTVFLETYFNHCREAAKLKVRNHRGKKSLNFEVQSLLYNDVQMFKQATDVKNMTTGDDMRGSCVCTQKTLTFSIYSTQKHLPFSLVSPSKISAGHPFYLTNPSRRGFPGQHRQGLRLAHHQCRWGHGRSSGDMVGARLWPEKFRFPVLGGSHWIRFCLQWPTISLA